MSATNSRSSSVSVHQPRHEVLGVTLMCLATLSSLALLTYNYHGGANWIGPVGESLAAITVGAFGLSAWVLPIELFQVAQKLLTGRGVALGVTRLLSSVVLLIIACVLLHLVFGKRLVYGGHPAGGILGEILGEVLRSLLGYIGALLICFSCALTVLLLRSSLTVRQMAWRVRDGWRFISRIARQGIINLDRAWKQAKALERGELLSPDALAVDASNPAATAAAPPSVVPALAEKGMAAEEGMAIRSSKTSESGAGHLDQGPTLLKKPRGSSSRVVAPAPAQLDLATDALIQPSALPPPTLLTEAPDCTLAIDDAALQANAVRLVEKLTAYGVKGRVDEIRPGPVVTMYEFEPASGTKISKIAGLSDDLAMALAAQKVRIVAPIPGKARVGFELPNDQRKTVYLREVIESRGWLEARGPLPMAFGHDIGGQPVYGDLSKMPHLLVAGATGAGKSVGLNVMLISLLMQKTPEEVRLLMIDPKVVELAVFDGIPHMLLPVVTDMKKAALALRWAVDEMERRYQTFAEAGVRSITTYNEKVVKVLSGALSPEQLAPGRANKVVARGAEGEEVLLDPDEGEKPDAVETAPQKLPHIVVVVDEFADLMMVAAKEVESAIARLAQKARAAGIHVILATQRPSVDVITGMIKANFPARMSFKVSQREDSKTILGRSGAEQLLGAGDMLFIPPGSGEPQRVHCAFISEDEVRAVCDYLREQGAPVYDTEILKPREEDEGETSSELSDDPLYDKAVRVVADAGYCSISHLQRQLSVGYNKAAKLVEQMEREGVVGPPASKAGGRREVLVQSF